MNHWQVLRLAHKLKGHITPELQITRQAFARLGERALKHDCTTDDILDELMQVHIKHIAQAADALNPEPFLVTSIHGLAQITYVPGGEIEYRVIDGVVPIVTVVRVDVICTFAEVQRRVELIETCPGLWNREPYGADSELIHNN